MEDAGARGDCEVFGGEVRADGAAGWRGHGIIMVINGLLRLREYVSYSLHWRRLEATS